MKVLKLTEMNLRCIRNLPVFPNVNKLDLTHNSLDDGQIKYILEKFGKLKTLYLTENFV